MRKSMAFLLFSLTIIAVPTFADPMTDAEALARYDAAAVHEFRSTLEDIIDMHSDIVAASGASELAAATARRKKVVRELGDADVARLMATGAHLSELRAQTAGLHDIVFRGEEPSSQLVGTNSTGFPARRRSPAVRARSRSRPTCSSRASSRRTTCRRRAAA